MTAIICTGRAFSELRSRCLVCRRWLCGLTGDPALLSAQSSLAHQRVTCWALVVFAKDWLFFILYLLYLHRHTYMHVLHTTSTCTIIKHMHTIKHKNINTAHHITGCHCEAILNEIPVMATHSVVHHVKSSRYLWSFLRAIFFQLYGVSLLMLLQAQLLPLFEHMTLL